jgi:hypothetical protein
MFEVRGLIYNMKATEAVRLATSLILMADGIDV